MRLLEGLLGRLASGIVAVDCVLCEIGKGDGLCASYVAILGEIGKGDGLCGSCAPGITMLPSGVVAVRAW